MARRGTTVCPGAGYRHGALIRSSPAVFRDFKTLNPSNDEFDLVRMVEYAAAPLHYTIGRDRSDSRVDDFIVDIGNGELSRDLNDYNGFFPVNQPAAAGPAAPTWG